MDAPILEHEARSCYKIANGAGCEHFAWSCQGCDASRDVHGDSRNVVSDPVYFAGVDTSLDLKFVVHHGDYFVQAVGDHVEVLGPDVNIAHRLLKNSAAQRIGSSEYALFTDAATETLDLPLADALAVIEPIDGMQPVGVRVIPLHE